MIKTLSKFFASVICMTVFSPPAGAAASGTIRFYDENSDTTRITSLLDEGIALRLHSPNAWVSYFAKQLIDTPYKEGTLEEQPEMLTVNMEYMDCTTFVENVLALAMTANDRRGSWRDVVYNLQQLRYRGGEPDGYPSRLHYMSDWVLDNSSRGLIRDYTSAIGNASYEIKTLDFMSQNRDKYPALANDENYNLIRKREDSYRGHKYPYLKKNVIGGAQLRDGDIVLLITKTKGLDVSHVGFITMVDGKPHLLHASSKEGKVVISKLTLQDYLKRDTSVQGIRVLRLCD